MAKRKLRSAASLDQEPTAPNRKSARLIPGNTPPAEQPVSRQQAIDPTPRSCTRKGKRKQPPDDRQSPELSKRAATGGDILAGPTDKPVAQNPTGSSARRKYIRISGLPLDWDRDNLFSALRTIDPSLTHEKCRTALYPACSSSTQIALLNLDSGTEPLERHKYLSIWESASKPGVLTIDSNFYDLTPLNAPPGGVVAELAVGLALEDTRRC